LKGGEPQGSPGQHGPAVKAGSVFGIGSGRKAGKWLTHEESQSLKIDQRELSPVAATVNARAFDQVN
jgi:hypothetical protein